MSPLQKITEAQMDANGVCSAPNVLNDTVPKNKAMFDKMVRSVVAPVVNAAVDAVNSVEMQEATIAATENNRISAENSRVAAENSRVTAETGRKTAENARETNEMSRETVENHRTLAENGRSTAEESRVAAEKNRESNETARGNAESGRAAAETKRAAAEAARALLEPYNPATAYLTGNKVTKNGSSYQCTADCTGISPPNAGYWLVIAEKGLDGQGSGDMLSGIYDPGGFNENIHNKADKLIPAAAGNLAGLDANGNLTDSGKKAGDFAAEKHANRHRTGGTDALKPGDIGAYTKAETLSDATAAALGLPNTAVPDDAFSMLQIQNTTSAIYTNFGTDGYLKDGKFSGLCEFIGPTSVLYNGYIYDFSIINSSIQDESVLCLSSSVSSDARTLVIRVKYISGAFSVVGVPFVLHNKKEVFATICETGTLEQYVVLYSSASTSLDVGQVQMIEWNGGSFSNVGSAFDVYSVSIIREGDFSIIYSGVPNEYMVLFKNESSVWLVQRVKWDGASFANVGTAFAVFPTPVSGCTIIKSATINEYIMIFIESSKLKIQRVKWSGTDFTNMGSVFVVSEEPVYSSTIMQSLADENYIVCYEKLGKICIQRLRWITSPYEGFDVFSSEFTVSTKNYKYSTEGTPICLPGLANESYYVVYVEPSRAGIPSHIYIQNVVWSDNLFENIGKKINLSSRDRIVSLGIIKSSSENVYDIFYKNETSGLTTLSAHAFSANNKNATALQTRNPNQKVLVVKE